MPPDRITASWCSSSPVATPSHRPTRTRDPESSPTGQTARTGCRVGLRPLPKTVGKEIEYVGASLKEPSSPPPPSCVAPFLWRSAPFLRQASPPISSRSGFSRIRFSSFEHFPNLAGELERCEWFRNKRRTTSKARTQPFLFGIRRKIQNRQPRS